MNKNIWTSYLIKSILVLLISTGCEKVVDTKTIPIVTTSELSNLTPFNATCGGNITSDGGSAIIGKGVCWSTGIIPTIADYKTTDGSGVGSFNSTIADLQYNTTYYVCAFATNEVGTGYGNIKSFTTSPVVLPSIFTSPVTNIALTTANCGGNISSDGGSTITSMGICWSISKNPTINDNIINVESALGNYSCNFTRLNSNTTYFAKAFATNIAGTSYGNEISFTTQLTDFDGNIYNAITIGNQIWLQENLKVTHYRNGDPVAMINDSVIWSNLATGGYCNYDLLITNYQTYGRLYNFYTVLDSRHICPEGWHVPSHDEWLELINYLGGTSVAAGKMKEVGTIHWLSPNAGATNSSGFTSLPSGMRTSTGTFLDQGLLTDWWSSYSNSSNTAIAWTNHYNYNSSGYGDVFYTYGMSIRCIKDK